MPRPISHLGNYPFCLRSIMTFILNGTVVELLPKRVAVAPIVAFLIRIFDAFVGVRRIEATRQTTQNLKATNRDFANIGYHDLVQRLFDDRSPIYLDGSQASK